MEVANEQRNNRIADMKVLWAINKKNNMGPANGDKALGHPSESLFLV